MAKRVAWITGVTGQDGAYLAEFLLNKGYVVHGLKRRSSSFNTGRVDHLYQDLHEQDLRFAMHYGDLTDATNRILKLERRVRFYQASTSELYGKVQQVPQSETTPFYPRSPYAAAKLYAYWIVVNYREAYGIHASNGILFNHEGPTRGETFVTRKITRAVAAIELGLQDTLFLGNLDAKRDWGHARDYVEGMWLITQQPDPDDYVLATGETRSVREFVEEAFAQVGKEIVCRGSGLDERGRETRSGRILVKIDPRYFRPTEVDLLVGDSTRAREKLGWRHKVSFDALVAQMVQADLELVRQEAGLRDASPYPALRMVQ